MNRILHRLKCSLCNYESRAKASMKWHVETKHEGKVYQCNKCDHTSSSLHVLKIHQMNRHEGVRFKCPKCDYEATQKGNLLIHRQAVHDGIVHACNFCNYKTSTKRSLNLHRKAKHWEYHVMARVIYRTTNRVLKNLQVQPFAVYHWFVLLLLKPRKHISFKKMFIGTV